MTFATICQRINVSRKWGLRLACLGGTFLLVGGQGFGQGLPRVSIRVLAKPRGGAICLRWAPDQPLGWQHGNRSGYLIERTTVVRDNQLLTTEERKLLTVSPVLPQPLENWRVAADTSRPAGVVAQALYGKTFQPSLGNSGSVNSIVSRGQENDQRFALALASCDQSFDVARLAGLGYTDAEAKPNESYQYRIYSALPATTVVLDTGRIYTSLRRGDAPEPAAELTAAFGDRSVRLQWDVARLRRFYNAYWVEKSEDGKTFVRSHAYPLMNANTVRDSTGRSDGLFFVDSLARNNQTYHYQLRGIDTFGDVSPPLATAKGAGQTAVAQAPTMRPPRLLASGQVEIQWEFPAALEKSFRSFSIQRAGQASGRYDTLVTGINVAQRRAIVSFAKETKPGGKATVDKKPRLLPSNYFTVTLHTKNGYPVTSYPALVQVPDSVAPARPTGLVASIDSAGVVRLQWQPGSEADLLGYRLYRANTADEEYFLLTPEPVRTNAFQDTAQLQTLTRKLYYKVVAVDKNYNGSGYSSPVVLTRPRRVPPAPPAFAGYRLRNDGLTLVWYNSTSEGVQKHRVFRNVPSENEEWTLVGEYTKPVAKDSLTDPRLRAGRTYHYRVTAVAEGGLSATTDAPFAITIPAGLTREKIQKLRAEANRASRQIDLTWKQPGEGVKNYWIYRSERSQPPVLLKVVDGKQTSYTDRNLTTNTEYHYFVKGVLRAGGETQPSEKVNVNY